MFTQGLFLYITQNFKIISFTNGTVHRPFPTQKQNVIMRHGCRERPACRSAKKQNVIASRLCRRGNPSLLGNYGLLPFSEQHAGCGYPVDTSAMQKHRPSRWARQGDRLRWWDTKNKIILLANGMTHRSFPTRQFDIPFSPMRKHRNYSSFIISLFIFCISSLRRFIV